LTSATIDHSGMAASRTRRAARWLGRGFGWLVLGLVLVLAALLVSINLTPLGGLLSAQVNAALQPMFQGQLLLRRLGQIDLDGVSGAELEVLDPSGHSVLLAQGVDVRLFWPRVALAAALGSEPLRIPIRRIAIERLQVDVIDDGSGTPTLAHAFEPRELQAQDEGAPPSLEVQQLTLAGAQIKGDLASVGAIDVELKQLAARLQSNAQGLALQLDQLELGARQLPGVQELSGSLTGELLLPAEPQPGAAAAEPPSGASSCASPETWRALLPRQSCA
jgi:hypothetical protein